MNLATYLRYWRLNFLTLLEYRLNFLMWVGFTIIYHGTAVIALWVTLHQFPSMNGWDFRELSLLYGLWMLGHAFHNTFFFTIGEVPNMVREGGFDRFLVRPLDPLFQALTVPQQIWPDELAMAIGIFPFITIYSGVHVDWFYVIFVPAVMIGGALVDFGIQLTVATLSFWVVRIDTLRWVVMSLEADFTRYPISIYTRAVQLILTFALPFAFMNFFPATLLLHKTGGGFAFNAWIGMLTPLVGLLYASLAYAFWRVGLRRYSGTGS
ncbi:MAG TPA: ABC-2 family transporter protein [Candidatus Baltobacteraceae bacterium]|nr:ABC-2 family transporter protein [Candidatus Baltobacteraceae bacterium]